jgi:hypothetical protein
MSLPPFTVVVFAPKTDIPYIWVKMKVQKLIFFMTNQIVLDPRDSANLIFFYSGRGIAHAMIQGKGPSTPKTYGKWPLSESCIPTRAGQHVYL